jgi:hypothetical protein
MTELEKEGWRLRRGKRAINTWACARKGFLFRGDEGMLGLAQVKP